MAEPAQHSGLFASLRRLLATALEMGFTRDDTALLVMPMCHANSLYFGYTGYISSAYAPTMLWTTQVLDAAVQTIAMPTASMVAWPNRSDSGAVMNSWVIAEEMPTNMNAQPISRGPQP